MQQHAMFECASSSTCRVNTVIPGSDSVPADYLLILPIDTLVDDSLESRFVASIVPVPVGLGLPVQYRGL